MSRVSNELVAALRSLAQDSTHYHKEALNGRFPDMYVLERTWKVLEGIMIRMDNEDRA